MSTVKHPRKGQAWSVDYTIGILLFLFAIIIGITIISNIFSNQEYEKLLKDAELVSDLLASPGYPSDWDNDTVYQIGLLTDGKVNISKLRTLYMMPPNTARKYLKTRNNLFVFIEDKDYGIVYTNKTCGYGDSGITSNGTVKYHTVAYYYAQLTDGLLLSTMNQTYTADLYLRDQEPGSIVNGFTLNGSLDNLTGNLYRYDTLVMENPQLDLFTGEYNTTALAAAYEDWVFKGNTLIIMTQVGLAGFLDAEFPSAEDGAGNVTIQEEHDDMVFTAGETILFSRKYSMTPSGGIADFVMVANYTNSKYGITTWNYGEGKVIYFGDVKGTYEVFGPYEGYENLTRLINYTISKTALGYCPGLDLTALTYDNLAIMQRYVVFDGKIAKLHVYLWQ
ncbi:MAG: hypothetical protein ABIJ21_00530 [Nanoarchaeota archaeon]